MTEFERIVARLKEERVRQGMSQRDLARVLKCMQSQISDWESGQTAASLPKLRQWAEALGFQINLILWRPPC